MEVWQSCNGLLLCTHGPDKLYVYNPTTNHSKLLPLPHLWAPIWYIKPLAMAFDPTLSPHYKILYARQDYITRLVHLQIYSSEAGIWRPCAQTFSRTSFIAFDSRAVYWRDAIHWLSRIHVFHFSLKDMDNPLVEDHRTLYGIRYGGHDKLLVSRDCLLLVKMLPHQIMNVYESINHYSGWSLKYQVNLEPAPAPPLVDFNLLSLVIGETEEDSFLVLQVTGTGTRSCSMLLRFNIISKTFHHLCDLTQFHLRYTLKPYSSSFFFTPSLVAV
ncbi:hypothetical protein QVD17_15227 [Tagetes erecta]|nr:hypothetical protein QVD17_15227 [Tagetes erecta]